MQLTKKQIRLLSFFIPILIFLAVLFILNIFPFGEYSLITLDLDTQYISFLSYLREIVTDPSTVFYSFSKTLGGDMIGLISYYLISPLNLITLLFSIENLPYSILLISLLKIGFAGLTFNLYLEKNDITSLIFSTSYALMAFYIANLSNLLWLDSIIMLPIIAIGIKKIINGKPPFIYLFSLSYAIIANYYIGYMICIFSVLYYCYLLLFCNNESIKLLKNSILKFSLASLLAGGLLAIILIPAKYSLETAKTLFDFSNLSLSSNFANSAFIQQMFIGNFTFTDMIKGEPLIYCSLITLICTSVYFLSNKVNRKEKIGSLILLIILLVSLKINAFNLIWHGFSAPNWFPYRYTFISCFFLLTFAYKGCTDTNKKTVGISLVMILSLFLYSIYRLPDQLSMNKILITFIILAIYCILLLLRKHKIVNLIVVIVVSFEMLLNSYFIMKELNYLKINDYKNFVNQVTPSLDYINSIDDGFYRFEKTFYRTQDDPMLLNYKGLSHNSSSESDFVRSYFFSYLGFCTEDNWTYYNRGTTYANDSLLGIKYLLTDKNLGSNYSKLQDFDENVLYKNEYTLPFVVNASKEALDYIPEYGQWFTNQNEIWKALSSSINQDIMEQVTPFENNLIGLEYVKEDYRGNVFIRQSEDGYVERKIVLDKDAPLFLYMTAIEEKQIKITVNDEFINDYFTYGQHQIINLGNFKTNEEISIKYYPVGDDFNIFDEFYFIQNNEVFKTYFDSLTNDSLDITHMSNASISGTINTSKDSILMFQIPYDKNWNISIDGKHVESKSALGLFLAAECSEGSHSFSLSYKPPGLNSGLIISSLSLLILLSWVWIIYKKK